MNFTQPLIRNEWFKGGVQCLRQSTHNGHPQFYLWATTEGSDDRAYYSVVYNPTKFKIKAGEEYVFQVDIIQPVLKGGSPLYILKGLMKL